MCKVSGLASSPQQCAGILLLYDQVQGSRPKPAPIALLSRKHIIALPACPSVCLWASPLKLQPTHQTDTGTERCAGALRCFRINYITLHCSRARLTVPLWAFLWCAGPRCCPSSGRHPKAARSGPLAQGRAHAARAGPSSLKSSRLAQRRLAQSCLAQSRIAQRLPRPKLRRSKPPRSRAASLTSRLVVAKRCSHALVSDFCMVVCMWMCSALRSL